MFICLVYSVFQVFSQELLGSLVVVHRILVVQQFRYAWVRIRLRRALLEQIRSQEVCQAVQMMIANQVCWLTL